MLRPGQVNVEHFYFGDIWLVVLSNGHPVLHSGNCFGCFFVEHGPLKLELVQLEASALATCYCICPSSGDLLSVIKQGRKDEVRQSHSLYFVFYALLHTT